MTWQPADDLAQAVALEVLLHGPLARSELARRLGLAPATLTRISSELIELGLLLEAPRPTERKNGRPSVPLDVVADAHHFLGIKVSGDAVMAAIIDLRADVLGYFEEPLVSSDPDSVVDQICGVSAKAGFREPIDAIGIGLGGVVDRDGVVKSAPFLGWEDVPIARLVQSRTETPSYASNDLAAFTESQHWFGLGTGHDNFATLTMGVGVGFGCVANGKLLANADSGVGLVGHWPLDPLGPLCSRGHRGCAEAMLTLPCILRDASFALDRPVEWTELITLVKAGHPAASAIARSSGRALGRLIAAIANLTAPDLVIVGGEAVDLAAVASDVVEEGIREHRDPRASDVRVELTSGSNESWCRGAAVAALQRYVLDRRRGSPRGR
ncbi:MAG: ROK family protein [Microbacteriaceae bacterium]|nr:MAG: ROK family protein [Microbacteriaceae bacterium]